MKDAFERRALLLHLGDALNAIQIALAAESQQQTLQQLIAANPTLADQAWLASVSAHTGTHDFAKNASAAFATWPALLLEEQVDYAQLAVSVQRHLFASNMPGWRAYVDTLKPEIAWFGDGLPTVEDTTGPEASADETDSVEPDAGDIERGDAEGETRRESVEGSDRLYPAWPWKPGV